MKEIFLHSFQDFRVDFLHKHDIKVTMSKHVDCLFYFLFTLYKAFLEGLGHKLFVFLTEFNAKTINHFIPALDAFDACKLVLKKVDEDGNITSKVEFNSIVYFGFWKREICLLEVALLVFLDLLLKSASPFFLKLFRVVQEEVLVHSTLYIVKRAVSILKQSINFP